MTTKTKTLCIVVQMDKELFDDEDHLAIKASTELCKKFEDHIRSKNHTIPDWLENGGCEEDWGVYFESQINDQKLKILFGCYPEDDLEDAIMIRIYPYVSFFKSIFKKPKELTEEIKNDLLEFTKGFKTTKSYEE